MEPISWLIGLILLYLIKKSTEEPSVSVTKKRIPQQPDNLDYIPYNEKEQLIRSAIANKQKIKIIYKKSPKFGNDEVTERIVIPKIIGYGDTLDGQGYQLDADDLYIRGYCELRQDERTFKLDRIIKVEVID